MSDEDEHPWELQEAVCYRQQQRGGWLRGPPPPRVRSPNTSRQSSLAAQEGTNPTYNRIRDALPRKLPTLGTDTH